MIKWFAIFPAVLDAVELNAYFKIVDLHFWALLSF